MRHTNDTAPPLFALDRDLDAEFAKFHHDNPHVFDLFRRFANEVRAAGHMHYSAEAIMQRIRWHCTVETKSDDGFKLNDHHRARYARLLVESDGSFAGFFEFRKRIDASGLVAKESVR